MNNDNLANVLSAIGNSDAVKRPTVVTRCNSKVVQKVLDVLKTEGYVDGFETVDNGQSGELTIVLNAKINRVGAIKPRFSVTATGFTKYEKRYLPAQGFGVLVVSTPQGIMTHEEAKSKNIGGKLLAYCY